MRQKHCIGIDFDNTIAIYDELFYHLALKKQLIDVSIAKDKQQIRDHIRTLDDGEAKWTQLQALAYGAQIAGAKIAEGFYDFARTMLNGGHRICIISHKTRYPAMGVQVALRPAALSWMENKDFFNTTGLNLDAASDVFFESTRADKMARIKQQNCDYFIDDLRELLLEPGFPSNTQRMHYAPGKVQEPAVDLPTYRSWRDIATCFTATSNPLVDVACVR